MKYLKAILNNPWVVLVLIIFLVNTYFMVIEGSTINTFASGFTLCNLIYIVIDKARTKHTNSVISKLDKMSRATKVVLEDSKGNKISEDDEEYLRGFRQASLIILEDLE